MKRIKPYKAWIFLLFGFHLYRIWILIDRNFYADF